VRGLGSGLAAAAWIAAAAIAQAAPNDIVAQDLAERSSEIHWPVGFAPPAVDMFSHNAATIHASCARVWDALIAAPAWPQWYSNSHDVRIADGAARLTSKATFEWETFGHPIRSRVAEFTAERRLAWFGDGPNVQAYHTWLLQPASAGCLVITEEESRGPAAQQGRKTDPGALHRGHDLWLDSLEKLVAGRR